MQGVYVSWISKNSFRMVISITMIFCLPLIAYAEETKYSLGVGFEFASGTYGTGVTTNAIYVPVTAAIYPTDRLDVALEIPYIYQSTSSVVAGQYMGMQQNQSAGGQTGMAAMGSSGMGGMGSSGMGESGIGDIRLKAGYILYSEEEYVPAIRPNFHVKFPTADKNRFLGTGAFDEGFAVELTKWFGKWFADGEVGYTIQGKSSVLSVKNYLNYYAGGGYKLFDNLRVMALVKGSSPTVEGASGQLEARLKIRYQLTSHTGLDGYLAKGIATASPDYGSGLAISYEF